MPRDGNVSYQEALRLICPVQGHLTSALPRLLTNANLLQALFAD